MAHFMNGPLNHWFTFVQNADSETHNNIAMALKVIFSLQN